MTKLKKLNELHFRYPDDDEEGYVNVNELVNEAINWISELQKAIDIQDEHLKKMVYPHTIEDWEECDICQEAQKNQFKLEWIRKFFDIDDGKEKR